MNDFKLHFHLLGHCLPGVRLLGLCLLGLCFLGVSMTADANADTDTNSTAVATFAGGCFWCMEPPFDKLKGVKSTTSGYTNGHKKNPTYREVSTGSTGHTEAVQVSYDPNTVSYSQLLDVFWSNIDPTVKDRQFCDKGTQYRTGIYFNNADQQQLAQASMQQLIDSKALAGQKIYTQIEAASTFTPAEDYHQDYYIKNPVRYQYYRYSCGRDKRLKQLWGKGTGH